jgi:CRP-like cAMP-binding protein
VGRGLSELQKTILMLAHENRERGMGAQHLLDGGQIGTDVKYPDVLEAYFGWEPDWRSRSSQYFDFSKVDIGEKAYRSARASLSRAFSRLEARGLIVRTHGVMAASWTGADLTEKGVKEAVKHSGELGLAP